MLEQIRLIEIELFSQCNRQCSWCPNSYIDRHSENHELDEEVFIKLIDELAEHNYSKYISFSRYNEPFMHRDILEKRIAQIRERLPNVTLVTNTNGDFYIGDIDIDEVTIMDYDNKPRTFDNCVITFDNGIKWLRTRLGKINNRGGSLDIKSEVRTEPCFEPQYFVGIDYTGDVTPCCNIRGDIKKHRSMILGNLHDDSLENILNSFNAKRIRRITSYGGICFPEPCQYCNKEPGRYTKEHGGIDK